jgi:large subunit ribosomal protein L6
MSNNIGKKIIFISSKTSLYKYKNLLIIKGVYGVLKIKIKIPLIVLYNNFSVVLKSKKQTNENFRFKSLWGTYRILLLNNFNGLYKLHFCKLKFIGVGYKAFLKKENIILRLGFSHKIFCKKPKNLIIKKIKKRPPIFLLKSFDFEIIQIISHQLRSFKKPEPYKGKGIRFLQEVVKKKQGKKSKN